MISIGICDDDELIRKKLKTILEKEDIDFKIYEFKCGEELVSFNEKIDILFLDIDMGGINGIETGKELRKKDKELKIIYLTSFSDYTHLAFKVHAFGYLTKPFEEEDIVNELKEALEYIETTYEEEELEFVSTDGVVRLKPKDIYYFEYFDRKVNIVTKKKDYLIKDKITRIINVMEEYNFYSPHKSFTANLFHVKSIKGYEIYMMNEDVIPLSQKRSKEFRDKLNEYISDFI
ncbi:LytTR family DNA-binding domain-containing protein [uncultured Clostridium sp.]|uniref:LytR/AlgR family response regulator transcription factor n=1 Tax=uncultured Clostridium sp. TaxID=59620 RepID=UPI0026313D63|nr:LytTR family DNA-binding domain-containing protein [uncultured Clostridium sp.]